MATDTEIDPEELDSRIAVQTHEALRLIAEASKLMNAARERIEELAANNPRRD